MPEFEEMRRRAEEAGYVLMTQKTFDDTMAASERFGRDHAYRRWQYAVDIVRIGTFPTIMGVFLGLVTGVVLMRFFA